MTPRKRDNQAYRAHTAQPAPRYKNSRSPKRQGPSYGWEKNVTSAPGVPDIGSILSLLELLRSSPIYDGGDEAEWDRLLSLLNLGLCFQPAVSVVIRQGRWRTADNPRAYVATAAYRLGLSMGLPDFGDRLASPGIEPDEWEEEGEDDLPEDLQIRQRTAPHGGYFDSDFLTIPEWLQDKQDYSKIDWVVVAKHSALKPSMVPSLAFTLSVRFGDRLSREAAVREGRRRDKRYKVAAHWKWIDRNFKTRIAPLFRLESKPEATERTSRTRPSKSSRISPWDAIRQACARECPAPAWVGAPSIMQEGNTPLSRYTILQPKTLIWRRDSAGIIEGPPYRVHDPKWGKEREGVKR